MIRKEGGRIMRFVGNMLCLLMSVAVAAAQTNWVDLTSETADQGAPALKIVKARGRQQGEPADGNARSFSIIVENTGERPIKSIDFLFDVVDRSSELASDANGNRIRCGFVIEDLDIKPGDTFTIERISSGLHCIPLPSSKQVVRVQKLIFSDGSEWVRPGHEESGWQRVKTQKPPVPNSKEY